jgi:hypothetical protein
MTEKPQADFFETLPTFEEFSGVADAKNYRPLPDGWSLATADIVSSTRAIERGEYKAVNMAGASVISAVLNALGHRKIPFVFGGDGALLAVPQSDVEKTREALALTQVWVKEDLGLDLRAAIVPMSDIRKHGHDVRVARFRASSNVAYAMFLGGGASWAESQMKAGKYAVPKAPPQSRPDLTGLSCRWDPIAAKNGEIVSIIVPSSRSSSMKSSASSKARTRPGYRCRANSAFRPRVSNMRCWPRAADRSSPASSIFSPKAWWVGWSSGPI